MNSIDRLLYSCKIMYDHWTMASAASLKMITETNTKTLYPSSAAILSWDLGC